ncbi:MAG: hypothetical protein ACE37B_05740 [Ilumatobacter sp.]|uniref:hypothetical protein n=1 Tax=Ilumatobacter sp. TaxID=1967498 RepID=UPI00391BDFD6
MVSTFATITAVIASMLAPPPATAASSTASSTASSVARPWRSAVPIEVLDLVCTAKEGGAPTVQCRWSVPRSDAAGVRVVRRALVDHAPRTVIFRTDDVTQNSVTDEVRAGARYLFAVQAVDGNGRVVAASRPVVVGVAPTTAELVRLECEQVTAERVSCSWSDPVVEGRTLTLWRSVDGGARSVVASFGDPFPTAYGDGVSSGATSVAYAVIVTDGGGEIVARSRAETVRLHAGPTVPTTSVVPVDARPEVAPPLPNQPVDVQPVEAQPVETRPESQPVDTRPEVQSAETRPEVQPVDTRPEVRPVETRPEVQPAEVPPVETQPDVQPVETRPERSESTRGGDG